MIKAPRDKIDRVTDTLETLIASKKKTQWKEIKKPQSINISNCESEICILFFKILITKINARAAIRTLNQTIWKEFIEINDPKIAVNPKIKTIK